MTKNLIITLVGTGVLAAGIPAAIIVPKQVGHNNYLKGTIAEDNGYMEEAMAYYEAAAKRHDADALYRLGEIYMEDSITWGQAVEAYEEAYKRGKTEAAFPLSKAYMTGAGVEQDAKKGFAYAKEAADNEDARSCMLVGYCYENGLGTIRDDNKAFEYYQHSATQDNPDGLFGLACCYMNGIGVAQDTQKGQAMIEESAQLGSEMAKRVLQEQELERQRQEAEQKRLEAERRRAYGNEMVTCPKCHGAGSYYDYYSHKRIWCLICCGKGRCTRDDAANYDEIPFW